jgi:hypothetical protein
MKQANLLEQFLRFERAGIQQIRYRGGIDNVQPGQFSGWVIAEGVRLHEVRLIMGDILLAKAEINQPRPDVCQTLNYSGQPGFTIELSHELPQVDWQCNPKAIAISLDGTQHTQISILGNRKDTTRVLKTLLQSELLGMIGHCDGLVQGLIRGWAGWKGQAKPATVWLQAEGEVPIEILCDGYRAGMQSKRIHSKCGFEVASQDLPLGWAGKDIWFSFDHEGTFRLPQGESIVVPDRRILTHDVIASSDQTDKDLTVPTANAYQSLSGGVTVELSEHWRRLEEFKLYLDQVEQYLDRHAKPKYLQEQNKQRSLEKKSWLRSLFSRE